MTMSRLERLASKVYSVRASRAMTVSWGDPEGRRAESTEIGVLSVSVKTAGLQCERLLGLSSSAVRIAVG